MRRIEGRDLKFALVFLAALLPGLAHAQRTSQPATSPSSLLAAFDETCRHGFPDLQAVRAAALAGGWTERSIRPVGGNAAFRNAALPQVLAKGDLTLFLQTPNAIGMKHSCQVAGPIDSALDLAALASAASTAFGLGTPTLSRAGGNDLAQWRSSLSLVQVSINRRPRSASLQLRLEP